MKTSEIIKEQQHQIKELCEANELLIIQYGKLVETLRVIETVANEPLYPTHLETIRKLCKSIKP